MPEQPRQDEEAQHIDPVWGMTEKESPTALKSKFQGQTYYFCSRGCTVAFDKNPSKYLQGGPQMKL
jgi:YHS domain-containing protein